MKPTDTTKNTRATDIKVFISSTFADLDRERNYISQVVFQQLRNEYQTLALNEIDLRWGITEEQAANGRVIDLCLHYVHECQPFFIGILGDRYGSSFSSNDIVLSPIVEEYFPKVTDDIRNNLGATEIEILNGVLRNPKAKAIFFIKKDAKPYPGETPQQWLRLNALKDKVRASGHKVVEYSTLEDFDVIKDFIKEHLGSPTVYRIPVEGMERADRISRLHYERSLEYAHKVPYDNRLDRLLQTIDDTVSKSKRMCACIGPAGFGKSTSLAYMAHNFLGERIYVPLYGDIDELPSTTEDIEVFLKNAMKNAIFKQRERKSRWFQFKEWFRDGLKEIDFDNNIDLYKEILRHKWCFVLDNYESSEWLGYPGLSGKSFCKLSLVMDKIQYFFNIISSKYKKPADCRFIMARDVSKAYFDKYISWTSSEPVLDLSYHWWFPAKDYVPSFMAAHLKNLYPQQLEKLVKAPMHCNASAVLLTCNYMVEFVKFNEVDSFINSVNKAVNMDFPYRLYIGKIVDAFGKSAAVKAMIMLIIYRSGISLREFEAQLNLNHVDFLFLLRLISPFIIYTSDGVRLKNHVIESDIRNILGISDDMVISTASAIADRYHREMFEDFGYSNFEKQVKTSFKDVAAYFDPFLPKSLNVQLLKFRPRGTFAYHFSEQAVNQHLSNTRINYWLTEGHLNDDIILQAYNNLRKDENSAWSLTTEKMRNYLMACYAARMTDRLMATVHNPFFIKKMWNYPLYLFVWNVYLLDRREFAAPYSPQYTRETFDMKALGRIIDFLFVVFYQLYLVPLQRSDSTFNFNLNDYLKNYPT